MTDNEITYLIRGAIFDVYNALGPGLLICGIREICVTSYIMQLCVRNELTMAVRTVMMN